MKTTPFILFILFFNIHQLSAQTQYQLGIGCRLTVDLLHAKDHGFWFNWKLAISGGAAYNVHWAGGHYYQPSVHVDYSVMQGGGGTKDIDALREKKVFRRKANSFLAFTFHPLQYGHDLIASSKPTASYYGKPLYYFSDFTYPVLTNPFKYSFSVGTSIVRNMNEGEWQRVAIGNLSVLNAQITYCNDGPPFDVGKIMGDQEDRYFTGDGIINVYNNKWSANNIEFAFHKFTGWAEKNYQASTALYYTEVAYKDHEQYKYNSGSLSCRILNTPTLQGGINKNIQSSWGVGIVAYDLYRFDIQHLIHFNRYYSHHVSPNPPKYGVTLYGQAAANNHK